MKSALIGMLAGIAVSVFIFFVIVKNRLAKSGKTQTLEGDESSEKIYDPTEQLLYSLTSILIGITQKGVINYWNPVAEETFQIKATQVVLRPLAECGVRWDSEMILSRVADCSVKNVPVKLDDILYTRQDGEKGFLGFTVIPIQKDSGKNRWFLLFGADVTRRRKMEEELKEKMRDLERFNKVAIGRELKMMELKGKIRELEQRIKDA